VTHDDDYEVSGEAALAARQLLNNKALKDAFSALEKQYYDQWLATPAHDIATLTAIKSSQDGLIAFRAHLEAVINSRRIDDFNSRARLRNQITK
jgi:hypothetical protein